MYPVFLDCGYTSHLFWESSLGEVLDLIKSKRRREQQEEERQIEKLKVRAVMDRNLAAQLVEMIAVSMSRDENAKLTPLSQYYPSLFDDEHKEIRNDNEMSQELQLNKARMEEFAYWHNNKRRKEET